MSAFLNSRGLEIWRIWSGSRFQSRTVTKWKVGRPASAAALGSTYRCDLVKRSHLNSSPLTRWRVFSKDGGQDRWIRWWRNVRHLTCIFLRCRRNPRPRRVFEIRSRGPRPEMNRMHAFQATWIIELVLVSEEVNTAEQKSRWTIARDCISKIQKNEHSYWDAKLEQKKKNGKIRLSQFQKYTASFVYPKSYQKSDQIRFWTNFCKRKLMNYWIFFNNLQAIVELDKFYTEV